MAPYSVLLVGLAAACFTVFVRELLTWLRHRKSLVDLAFALCCLGAAAYNLACAGEYGCTSAAATLPFIRAESVALSLSGTCFLWFASILSGKVPKLTIPAFAAFLGAMAIIQAATDGPITWNVDDVQAFSAPFPFIGPLGFYKLGLGPVSYAQNIAGMLLLGFTVAAAVRWFRASGSRESRGFLLSVAIVTVASLNDFLVNLRVYDSIFLIEYSWAAVVLSMSVERARQISEALLAKIDLMASEEKFRTLIEQSSEAVVLVEEDGKVIEFNEAAARLFGVDRDEILGKPVWDYPFLVSVVRERAQVHPEAARERFLGLLREGVPQSFEGTLRARDGSVREYRQSVFFVDSRQGPRMGSISHDITGIKRAEARLMDSLKEKRVLLREIHHRVKNNLQLISSLLFLKMKKVEDAAAREALKSCRNQVYSMALIHEDLYKSRDFKGIDFGGYLRGLAEKMVGMYGGEGSGIELELDIDPVELDIERAIPCALLVNELCTNALKYAYPAGFRGRKVLRLEFKQPRGPTARLVVEDRGVGVPPEVKLEEPATLGLRIVTKLAGQLRARLRLRREAGSRYEIEFPLNVD